MARLKLRGPGHALACACVALALLLPGRADALRVEDPTSDFAMELAIPEARVCVAFPGRLRDEDTCAGLDLETAWQAAHQFDAVTGSKGIMAATVRYSDWRAEVLVTRFDTGVHPWRRRDIDRYVRGVATALAARSGVAPVVYGNEPGSLYTVTPVRGRPVIHFTVDVGVPEGHPSRPVSRLVGLVFVSHGQAYLIIVAGAPEHETEHAALAATLARGVRMPPSDGDVVIASPRARLAYRLLAVLVPILAGAVLWFLVVTSRGKRARHKHDALTTA